MERKSKTTDSYMLLEEMQGWQEEEEHEEILEFCANQQRFSFKKNFHNELEKITRDISESDKQGFVSVNPENFLEHLWNFINNNPTSTLKTYKIKRIIIYL